MQTLKVRVGERFALTRPLKLAHQTFPTNTRGIVSGLGRTFVRMRFDGADDAEEEVPVNAFREEDPSGDPGSHITVVVVGLRPAIVSTVHSFQGRTVREGILYVISMATLWILHGICYSMLSRVRRRATLHFYRAAEITTMPNVVNDALFGMPPQASDDPATYAADLTAGDFVFHSPADDDNGGGAEADNNLPPDDAQPPAAAEPEVIPAEDDEESAAAVLEEFA